jgi:hypothetical protein
MQLGSDHAAWQRPCSWAGAMQPGRGYAAWQRPSSLKKVMQPGRGHIAWQRLCSLAEAILPSSGHAACLMHMKVAWDIGNLKGAHTGGQRHLHPA